MHIDKEQEGGEPHLTLRLFEKNAKRSGGVRAEVSVDHPFKERDTVRYEWSVRLADDFPTVAPANRWWLIGQWHDQPDKAKGGSWEGFPSHSPPVLLGFGERPAASASSPVMKDLPSATPAVGSASPMCTGG